MSKREYWVDYVKVFACILVVLGHFFQSMVKANILSDNNLYQWFITTIYYFHVPLFFICSGYLYQRYSCVDDLKSWSKNVRKKLVILGVPYFVFSTITWVLKTNFPEFVNDEIGGLGSTLFLQPISPYWYLYILFFIFVVTPTVKTRKGAGILLGAAITCKCLRILGGNAVFWNIYIVQGVFSNEIWFVLGILLSIIGIERIRRKWTGFALGAVFLILSVLLYQEQNGFIALFMGLLSCAAVVLIALQMNQSKTLDWFSGYTMPIYLMHTLFAAPVRIYLMKFGSNNAAIQVLAGIMMSFIGPIVAMKVLQAIKLDWIVYPGRLLNKGKTA